MKITPIGRKSFPASFARPEPEVAKLAIIAKHSDTHLPFLMANRILTILHRRGAACLSSWLDRDEQRLDDSQRFHLGSWSVLVGRFPAG